MIVKRLMDSTKRHHENIQNSRIINTIIEGEYSTKDVHEFTLKMYLLHHIMEKQLGAFSQLNLMRELDYSAKENTSMLLLDMRKLGIKPNDFYYALPVLELKSVFDILGSYYVLEMCRVSFFMLFHEVAQNFLGPKKIQLDFFNMDAANSHSSEDKWHLLTVALEKKAIDESSAMKIINAAKRCYETCKKILDMKVTAKKI